MNKAGFEELQHTADWALRVWAPDRDELFRQAAIGMNTLMGLKLEEGPVRCVDFHLTAEDDESLLVSFLNEILFYLEIDRIGFEDFPLKLKGNILEAELWGKPIRSIEKPIKAVTFHNLVVQRGEDGLEARLVFDV
ncbi:MAG: archease [Bellilinea sp.]|nr:MAG: archease [Bellilinea sp.]